MTSKQPRTATAVAGPDAVLKALADPHRRQMLKLVQANELPAGQIALHFDMTQQAVSLHLKTLARAGLLRERRDGTRHMYSLRPEGLDAVRDVLAELWPEALARLKRAVEAGQAQQGKARQEKTQEGKDQ
jgi:DNA-binding transcriptional ArsR family regulator